MRKSVHFQETSESPASHRIPHLVTSRTVATLDKH